MSSWHDTTRIPNADGSTGGYVSNIENYWKQYPELLPKFFVEQVREWDEKFPPIMQTIYPTGTAPGWNFQWNIIIRPMEMAPFVEPNSNTPMVTRMMKRENFVCKQVKEGYWIDTFDLNHGVLRNLIPTMTRQVHDAIEARIEYTLVQATLGTTWNDQNNARASTGNALSWQSANSTPLGDVIAMQGLVYRMSAKKPVYLFLGYDDWEALHDHPEIVDQLKHTDPRLLVDGMVTMLKTLAIKIVEGFYKEPSDESQLVGAPGRGDVREAISITDKHYFLEDIGLVTTPQVGRLLYARGEFEGEKQWIDDDKDQIRHKVVRSFCPVVEDYAKIGRIDFVDSANDVNLYTSRGHSY